jgi:hypothetical protein
MRAIRSGIVRNATAAKLMNTTPQASALHPARRAAKPDPWRDRPDLVERLATRKK